MKFRKKFKRSVNNTDETNKDDNSTKGHKYKKSVIWNYFSNETLERADCKFCCQPISVTNGNTSNLTRHLRSKHPGLLFHCKQRTHSRNNVDEIQFNDSHFLDMESNDSNKSTKSNKDASEVVEKSNKRSLVWNYFTGNKSGRAECNLCTKEISCSNGITSNLARHLKLAHPILSFNSKGNSSVSDDIFGCISDNNSEYIDEREQTTFDSNIIELVEVVVRSEPNENIGKGEKSDKRSSIWNFFVERTSTRAKCNLCSKDISFTGTTSNLSRHLRLVHSTIPVNTFMKILTEKATDESDTVVDKSTECVQEVSCNPDVIASDEIETEPDITTEESVNTLLQNTRKRCRKWSQMWKYFIQKQTGKAVCGTCQKTISFTKGATSNLARHLRMIHPELYIESIKMTCAEIDVTDLSSTELDTADLSCTEISTADLSYIEADASDDAQLKEYNEVIIKSEDIELVDVPVHSVYENVDNIYMGDTKEVIGNVKNYCIEVNKDSMNHNGYDEMTIKSEMIEFVDIPEPSVYENVDHIQMNSTSMETNDVRFDENQIDESYDLVSNSEVNELIEEINEENIKITEDTEERQDVTIVTTSVKRSQIWKYFIDQGDGRALCTICFKQLSFTSGTTSNLARHLQKKHPSTQFAIARRPLLKTTVIDNDAHIMNNSNTRQLLIRPNIKVCLNEGIQILTADPVIIEQPRKNLVWKHFTVDDTGKAMCNLCSKIISFGLGSISNLNRHLRSVHNITTAHYMENGMLHDSTSIKQTAPIEDGETSESTIDMNGYEESEEINVMDINQANENAVWKYFRNGKAKCNLCSKSIPFINGATCNLSLHLQKDHYMIFEKYSTIE